MPPAWSTAAGPALYAPRACPRSPLYLSNSCLRYLAPASMFSFGSNGSFTPNSAAVSGMSCISPLAPLGETAHGWKRDSCSMTACSSFGWTLCALAAPSMIDATDSSPIGSHGAFEAACAALDTGISGLADSTASAGRAASGSRSGTSHAPTLSAWFRTDSRWRTMAARCFSLAARAGSCGNGEEVAGDAGGPAPLLAGRSGLAGDCGAVGGSTAGTSFVPAGGKGSFGNCGGAEGDGGGPGPLPAGFGGSAGDCKALEGIARGTAFPPAGGNGSGDWGDQDAIARVRAPLLAGRSESADSSKVWANAPDAIMLAAIRTKIQRITECIGRTRAELYTASVFAASMEAHSNTSEIHSRLASNRWIICIQIGARSSRLRAPARIWAPRQATTIHARPRTSGRRDALEIA